MVNIAINSPGGSMDAIVVTVKLMELANNRGVKFRCYVKGAYSAAMYLYAACNWRYAAKDSTMLYHDPYLFMCGNFAPDYLVKQGASLIEESIPFNKKIQDALGMDLNFYNATKETYWLAPDLLKASPGFLKIMSGVKFQ